METIILPNDIPVHRIKAISFPMGIKAAHEKVHSLFPPDGKRKYYGISHGDNKGNILYWAAVSKNQGDLKKEALAKDFFIRKGKYISVLIKNRVQDETSVADAFKLLLQQEGIDPNGYCLEEYLNETDIRCSVPLL